MFFISLAGDKSSLQMNISLSQYCNQTEASPWTCPPVFAYDVAILWCSLQAVLNRATGSVVDTRWACSWSRRVCSCWQYNTTCSVLFRMSGMRRKTEQRRKFWAPTFLQGGIQKCLTCLMSKLYSCQPTWIALRWPLNLRRYFCHKPF